MRGRRAAASAIALTAVVGLVLTGCSQQSNTGASGGAAQAGQGFPETPDPEQVPGKPGGVFRMGLTEPTAIDPYNVQESEGALVAKQLFTGLVQVRPNGDEYPGVADTWTSNDNCTQWTFNLKSGQKFSDGTPLTSADFKRGWERTTAKASASEVAYHLNQVQGYEQMQAGTATTLSGVNATNPNTLAVALSEPNCEFELRTAHPALSPVPASAGAADNTTYNDLPLGNGPFRMDGPWQHDRGIKLVRNDNYTAGPKANLDAVEITITPADTGADAEYNGFRNGQFDWARMPTPVQSQARDEFDPQGKWISKKTAGINYLSVQVTKPPMNSVAARKAVSMAIDRAAITAGVFQGGQAPATAIVPPSFPQAYQEGVCDACTFNPDEAKRLAQEAGFQPGTELNFQFNTGGGHEEWTAAVRQQIEQNLGIKVNYSGVPFRDLLDNQQAPDATGIYRSAWGADYPTPANFLGPLLDTTSIGAASPTEPALGNNRGRYSNPEFDQLLARAAATKDEAQRDDLYKQAEQIAIGRDLAIIPMFQRQQYRLAATDRFGNVGMDFFENPTLDTITLK
ncbi:ABC transporter substrate-binding protein [Pseudonocardia alni]|uniref:peptide ABC transporter substrate-binding protein n=1 Tax=Pseudonocardia TaxID=1847 RepID=UPI000918E687|nr:peptide ABC transporter substrate-binding protein [Pseudonocardia sp. SID8383]OJG04601.1 Periplasmic oligopeptide-binding protein precursor [Pseudonocardia autotrophica]